MHLQRAMSFLSLPLLLGLATATAAQDWVEYVEETGTRLVIDAAVGVDDEEEKDIAAGDLDKDGAVDIVVARKLPFSNPGGRRNVLLMNESGVLTDRTATLAPDFLDDTDDRDIAVVDVDGDTWLDVVTVTTFGEQPRIYMNLGGEPWLGLDHEAARMPAMSPGPKFCAVGFGDVTGNGKPDLYFADYENTLEDRLLINDGSGFFSDETEARLTPEMAESVFGTSAIIDDMNDDGWNDIVKVNSSGNAPPPGSSESAVRILYNDGAGSFDFMQLPYTDAPYMVAVADYTQDGRPDMYVVDDAQDATMTNLGNDAQNHALFDVQEISGSPNTENFGGNVKFADLDNDQVLDLLVTDVDTDIAGCNRELVLLQGQGTPPAVTYTDPLNGAARPWLTTGTFDIETVDLNRDGALDLFIGTCDSYRVFIAQPLFLFRDGFESGDTSAW